MTNIPWMHWIRETSDALVESTSTRIFNESNIQYVNIGKICFLYLNATLDNGAVTLPYASEIDKQVVYYSGGAFHSVLLSSGTNTITLPTGIPVILSDFYFASL